MKILIVEDDLITRRLLQKILEEWGHEVVAADNGLDAWKLWEEQECKFIIADWIMPGMDGVELCRRVRAAENTGYVYFILLTGKDRHDDIIQGLEAGADDYIKKPFERDELKVRTRAGERVLQLEKELMEKNRELIDLNARLSELAMMDPLLEIGNRRSFYSVIEKVHYNASRYMQRYGLIMCDIDNFKSYNDTYGHLKGDHILKKVADAIRRDLRLSDEVFRFGGEEFVLVLPDQDREGTRVVAERLRKTVEQLAVEHSGTKRGFLTISCGVASYYDDDSSEKWEVVLNRADEALYAAKAGGRNKVALSSPVKVA